MFQCSNSVFFKQKLIKKKKKKETQTQKLVTEDRELGASYAAELLPL